VLLDGLDAPDIASKKGHRRGQITSFIGSRDRIVANVEEGLQVLRGQKPKANQP